MAQSARGITKWKISPISQCRGEEKRLKESAGEEGGAAIIRLLLRETLSSVRDLVTSQYPITISSILLGMKNACKLNEKLN